MANGPRSSQNLRAITATIVGRDSSRAAFNSAVTNVVALTAAVATGRAKLRDFAIIGRSVVDVLRGFASAGQVTTKTATEAELAVRRLDIALRNSGQASAENKQRLQAQADAIQATTRVSAILATETQEVLISMGKLDAALAGQLTGTLIDYVEAYRGGNGLIEISRQAARAIGGAGGDVGELGAVLDKFQTPAQRAASLIDQLGKKFGGAAREIGETATGQLAIFTNRIELARGQIGLAILQTTELRAIFSVIKSVLDAAGLGTINFTNPLKVMVPIMDEVLHVLREIIVGMIDFGLNVLPIVVEAIGAVIAALSVLAYQFGTALTQADALSGILGSKFTGALKVAGQALQIMGRAIGDVVGANVELQGTNDALFDTEGGFHAVAQAIRETGVRLQALVIYGKSWADLTTEQQLTLAQNQMSLNELFDKARDKVGAIGPVSENTSTKSSRAFEEINRRIKSTVNAAIDLSGAVGGLISQALGKAGSEAAVKDFGTNIINELSAEFARTSISPLFSLDTIVTKEGVGQVVETIRGPLGGLADELSAPFAGIAEGITKATFEAQAFGAAGATVADQLKAAFEPVGQLLGAIFAIPLKLVGLLLQNTVGLLANILVKGLTSIGILGAASESEKAAETAASLASLATVGAATVATAGGIAAAWGPAAVAASIATLGAALAFGAAAPATIAAGASAVIGIAGGLGQGALAALPGAATGAVTVGQGPIEVHPNEVIVPLNSPKAQSILGQAGIGGSHFTININGPTIRSDRDIRDIARMISEEIARKVQANNRLGGGGFIG